VAQAATKWTAERNHSTSLRSWRTDW